ncbi:allophanate hydrolase [Paludibaculum fermentans]|uniref:Allophanate hydrolase n=1 Tax=Paludibaculum fermentans TaxID=1473598 RepID=A0A7S7SI15_PALFE|nr:allophanate hydrolase [Paludibaculum fermentans]QOY85584.1 allophanate hydrolase [Paludibaculum fermentans]
MTPAERIRKAYERIRQRGAAPIWISLLPEEDVIRRTESIDPTLPLAGLTFAVKDNIDLAGLPTTAACPAFAYTPQRSATVVRLLEEAGAIAIGKTNLDQFATGLVGVRSPYGICTSVFSEGYISGGSSSGSAVSVALEDVDFALGTDTAGSGRVPAAFNNLIGLKPTRGIFSMTGVVPACRTLDCVSVFARDLTLAERVFRIAAQPDPEDWSTRTFQDPGDTWSGTRFRVGVPAPAQLEFFGDNESRRLFEAAVARCERAGGQRVEIDYEPFRAAAELLYSGPWVAERLAALEDFARDHAEEMHPVTRKIITSAGTLTAVQAFQAAYKLGELKSKTAAVWNSIDFLLLPTTGTIYKVEEVEADPLRLNTNLGFYTNFVNLLDLSALAIPAGFRPNGTPFGVTLIGPAMADLALARVAARLLPEQCVQVAVVGAHLTGQPLNSQLTSRGGTLVKTCRTSPDYRFYALANSTPAKPGLIREEGFDGPGIEVEIWSVPVSEFGSFVALIPSPLGIGTLRLDDGTQVKGFICEPAGVTGAREITSLGGWRAYLQSRA